MSTPSHRFNEVLSIEPVQYEVLWEMFSDETFVKGIVDYELGSSVLTELVRKGSKKAWEFIVILIMNGASKRRLIQSCAFHGRISFLENICNRGWHDYLGSWDDIVTSAAEGTKIAVLAWLEMDLGYMKLSQHVAHEIDTYDIAVSWSITNDDVDVFNYLMAKHVLPDRVDGVCYEAVTEWAPNILEYMCEKIGHKFVEDEIRENLEDNEWFEFKEQATEWLKDRKHCAYEDDIKEVMTIIDEIKDTIPEGQYLKISNLLLRAYKKM